MKSLLLHAIMFSMIPIIFSCTKNKSVVIDEHIVIKYENAMGADMLDPQSGIYKAGAIKIYYVDKNNTPVFFDHPLHDYANGYKILKDDAYAKGYVLSVFASDLNYEGNPQVSKSLIKLGDGVPDTLTCEFSMEPYSRVVTRVWYNGQLKWDVQGQKDFPGSPERLIRIVK